MPCSRSPLLLQAIAALLLLACDNARAPRGAQRMPSTSSSPGPITSTAPEPLEGVIAELQGKSGIVRVERHGGYQLLTLNNVVHAAQPLLHDNAPIPKRDPLLRLLTSRREQAGNALVIGLGSGATAAALAKSGYDLQVAEIEPAVITLARSHFGYTGPAEAIDGLEWLRREGPRYDLVLLDAFAGQNIPQSLLTAEAVQLLRARLSPGALVAVRLLGSPTESSLQEAIARLKQPFAHARLFGTGVADEPQNLYLIVSDTPLRLYDLDLGPVFARSLPQTHSDSPAPLSSAARLELAVDKQERRAALFGYLVRGEQGELCVDLPHWEMGARRYVLSGPGVDSLKTLIASTSNFPTSGDLSTDGNLSGTLHSLLGGGGVKMNTVRFSPVAVAVEGMLKPRLPPGATSAAPPQPSAVDPRARGPLLRQIVGGTAGELELMQIHFSLTAAQWRDLRQTTLRPLAAKAASALLRSDFKAAELSLAALLSALEARFGRFAPRVVTYDEIATLREALQPYLSSTSTEPAERAKRCDSVRSTLRKDYGFASWPSEEGPREISGLLRALLECGVRGYEQAAGKNPKTEAEVKSASRLVALLSSAESEELDEKQLQEFSRRAEALRQVLGSRLHEHE